MQRSENIVSETMLRRYRIMRLLYMGPLTYDEIEKQMTGVPAKGIVTALSKLLSFRDIKKERTPTGPPTEITEMTIAKGLLGIQEKSKYHYVLNECGKKKLAYLEWKHQLYTQVPPEAFPWGDGFNQSYYEEITDRIRRNGWPTG